MNDAVRAALAELVACHTESAGWSMSMMSNRAEFDAMIDRSQKRLEAAVAAARAALSEQPAHPAPVERVTLTDEQIDAAIIASTRKEECIADACKQVRWVPYHHTRVIARAVLAEYERANGISESAAGVPRTSNRPGAADYEAAHGITAHRGKESEHG